MVEKIHLSRLLNVNTGGKCVISNPNERAGDEGNCDKPMGIQCKLMAKN